MLPNHRQKKNKPNVEEKVRAYFFIQAGPINRSAAHVFDQQITVSLFNQNSNRDVLRKHLHSAIEVITSKFSIHTSGPCEICKGTATGYQHSTFPRSGDPRPNSFPPFVPHIKGYVNPICGAFCGSQLLKQHSAKEQFPGLGATKIVSCKTCGKEGGIKNCGGCESFGYCSKKCQKADWPSHKKECKRLQSALSLVKGGEKELETAIQKVIELHGVEKGEKEHEEALRKLRDAPGGKNVFKVFENAMGSQQLPKEDEEPQTEEKAIRVTNNLAQRAKDCGKEQEFENMVQEMKKIAATRLQISEGEAMFIKAAEGAMDRLKAEETDKGVDVAVDGKPNEETKE